ncbi:MAG TPA: NrsF family protein, partial [Rubrivivax sp.]|nr:NrsF family protein [Rubrivivax sp.]
VLPSKALEPGRQLLAEAEATADGVRAGDCRAGPVGRHPERLGRRCFAMELSPAFVAVWYTLGVGAAAALGALLGPRLLHW